MKERTGKQVRKIPSCTVLWVTVHCMRFSFLNVSLTSGSKPTYRGDFSAHVFITATSARDVHIIRKSKYPNCTEGAT